MLDPLPSRTLLLHVLEDPMLFKQAGSILSSRPPDEDAAALLLEAYKAKRAPPWLTAQLLGCLRARSTYSAAREILLNAPGLLAETYAGVAMARIAGLDARVDLLELLRRAEHWRSRQGALYGLAALRDPSLAPLIRDAVRDGFILCRDAGAVLSGLDVPTKVLVEWLASADDVSRQVALDTVFHLSAKLGGLRDLPLALAARRAMSLGTVKVAPRTRKMLEERIDKLCGQAV
jgi:hypothetical protein